MKNKKISRKYRECNSRNYITMIGIQRTTLKFSQLFHSNNKSVDLIISVPAPVTCLTCTHSDQNSMKQQLFAELMQTRSDTVSLAGATQLVVKA